MRACCSTVAGRRGKSTVVAMLALAEAVWKEGTRVLLVSRSQRQSKELFPIMTDAYRRMGEPVKKRLTEHEMELENLSRVVCLPCREDKIRGYANVSLLVITRSGSEGTRRDFFRYRSPHGFCPRPPRRLIVDLPGDERRVHAMLHVPRAIRRRRPAPRGFWSALGHAGRLRGRFGSSPCRTSRRTIRRCCRAGRRGSTAMILN
jgi:hypothetical protein